jgi:hypothetical protein
MFNVPMLSWQQPRREWERSRHIARLARNQWHWGLACHTLGLGVGPGQEIIVSAYV